MHPEVEALGRWSVGVQLATVTLLAVFFVALTRTIRRQEVRVWAVAWVADALAIASAFLGAFLALPPIVLRSAVALYVAGKTAYALLVVTGAHSHLQPGASEPLKPPILAVAVAAWSFLLGFLSPGLKFVQVSVSLIRSA